MQQRVALVRAMALGAPLLLMDEPFAALDEITRADMRHLLARLCEQLDDHRAVRDPLDRRVGVHLRPRRRAVGAARAASSASRRIDLPRPRHPELEDDPAFFAIETRLRALLHEGAGR